jgi:methylenetetrahydrofolate dehydrogenase (NADP+)/methenyltetrahydrofolate cyclohydrolase
MAPTTPDPTLNKSAMNPPLILDGKLIAAAVLDECRAETAALTAKGIVPGLAVVLVGDDPASQVYVGSKARTCAELGFLSRQVVLPAATTQQELLEVVRQLNADPAIHGILVQSPPPPHIHEEEIIRAIDPRKDVDGFHPQNVAKLVLEDPTGFVPCTPAGCLRLLESAGLPTAGAEAVVIGRSMIVGKPLAMLLVSKKANATVTIAHSRSKDLPAICRRADILIAAVGRPEMVKADWVKPGAVVIDVGINRIADASKKSGFRLTGDVAYAEVAPLCAAITPVPGGVGPMTIAMLMKNTLQAARQIEGSNDSRH